MFEIGQVVWVLDSPDEIYSMRVERVNVDCVRNEVHCLLSWKIDNGETRYSWKKVENNIFRSLDEAREAWELSRNTQELQATRGNK